VTLVSSAEETAKDVYRVLAQAGQFRDPELPPPHHRFLATGDPEPFERLGRRFLGPEVEDVMQAVRPQQPGSTVPDRLGATAAQLTRERAEA
jgi:glutamate racemase